MTQSEFKFFQLIEDTIEGVVTFVDRFLITVFYLAFLPHRFPERWKDETGQKSFVRPFSTTAFSLFILYLGIVHVVRHGLSQEYPDTFSEMPRDYRHYFTLTRLFLYSVPIILGLYWLARLFSRLTVADNYRSEMASLVLYACSFQFLALAMVCFFPLRQFRIFFALYGFGVSTLILWRALPSKRSWIERSFAGIACICLSLIGVLSIVVGFAIELGISAAGPMLIKEIRQNEVREIIDKVMEDIEDSDDRPG